MQTITNTIPKPARPVRAVQFGAGVFLRGFAGWMLEELTERCGWEGSVTVVKSTSRPGAEALVEQNGLYTVALRGLENGESVETFRAVKVIDRVLSATRDYAEYAALAKCPTLRFVLSNTTEAGIRYEEGDDLTACPPKSYPAKMTALAGIFCTFPHPKITFFQAFFVELVITAVLMCLIYALVDGRNTAPKGNLGGLLIGLLVALIGASFGPLTGFAMNAARDFGPRLFAALAGWGTDVMTGYPLNDNLSLPYFLVPLIAPIIGACIGGWIYKRIIVVALDRTAAAEDKA